MPNLGRSKPTPSTSFIHQQYPSQLVDGCYKWWITLAAANQIGLTNWESMCNGRWIRHCSIDQFDESYLEYLTDDLLYPLFWNLYIYLYPFSPWTHPHTPGSTGSVVDHELLSPLKGVRLIQPDHLLTYDVWLVDSPWIAQIGMAEKGGFPSPSKQFLCDPAGYHRILGW